MIYYRVTCSYFTAYQWRQGWHKLLWQCRIWQREEYPMSHLMRWAPASHPSGRLSGKVWVTWCFMPLSVHSIIPYLISLQTSYFIVILYNAKCRPGTQYCHKKTQTSTGFVCLPSASRQVFVYIHRARVSMASLFTVAGPRVSMATARRVSQSMSSLSLPLLQTDFSYFMRRAGSLLKYGKCIHYFPFESPITSHAFLPST